MAGLVCPLCDAYTAFTPAEVRLPEHISEEPAYIPAIVRETGDGLPFVRARPQKGIDTYAIVRCQGCGGLFVAQEEAREQWIAVYPIPHKAAPNEVPEPAKSEFEEASLCFAVGAYRACISMCQIAVEHVWHEQGVSGLSELKDKGIIPPRLFDRANEVRLWGNLEKHQLFVEPVSSEDSEQLVGYVQIILNEVYVEPKRLDRLTKKRKELGKKD